MVSDGHVKSGGGSRRRENIHNAGQYFLKVLEAQPESLVAAVGLGVVLTEKSRLSEAVKIFSRIRETAGNSQMPGPGVTHAYLESLLNLAHLYSHSEKPENERQYDVAIKLVSYSAPASSGWSSPPFFFNASFFLNFVWTRLGFPFSVDSMSST